MPSWIASNLTGALVRLLAGSLVALVFVFRCGDTQASSTPPVGAETNEIGRAEPPTIPTDARPTIALASVFVAMPSAHPSGATTPPGLEPTPEPKIELTNALVETTVPSAAPTTPAPSATPVQTATPTFAPSPTPIPALPSTPSPIVTHSPTPTAPPTVAPTKAPTPQPTASPTQRSTASPTQRLNSPPQIERIGDQTGKMGQQFVIGVSAGDPDGDKITLGCGGADKFIDNGNGSGTFWWTGTKAGKYAFTCSASDGQLSSSTTFAIAVN